MDLFLKIIVKINKIPKYQNTVCYHHLRKVIKTLKKISFSFNIMKLVVILFLIKLFTQTNVFKKNSYVFLFFFSQNIYQKIFKAILRTVFDN